MQGDRGDRGRVTGDISDNMMEGGHDEWTTIDRKASKKKSKEETKPVVVEDGWEQVNKKDKRKKDSVASQGGQDAKGRNNGGQRGGGRGRGGDRSDSGSNKGTLPRKNSSKPPRGGVRDR